MNSITTWGPWVEQNLVILATFVVGGLAAHGFMRVRGRWMLLYIPFAIAAIASPMLIRLQLHNIVEVVRAMS